MSYPVKSPDSKFTYADYLTWADDKRYELIDGEPYDMTPAPSTAHQVVFRELFLQLGAWFEKRPCQLFSAPFDFRLARPGETEDQIRDVVQPDIAVICAPDGIDEKGGRKAPDFVIEILSPSTASKDHIIKRRLYERHGVKEYWLVHPDERIVTVYRLSPEGSYGKADIFDGEDLRLDVAAFPGLTIDFATVFPPRPNIVRECPFRYETSK
ncbi:MAG: hypothetical protein BWY66_00405 [bacterium ADurb.Bin374]|nr:MAG: hypothetical protein BWY66_00405 [bacterium ADurb.Bin374]